MTKYYQPAPKSVSKKVMDFFKRYYPLQYTTGAAAGMLNIKYGLVSDAICKLRNLGILKTDGKEGHQFNPDHGVLIGAAPKRINITIRRESQKQAKQAEYADSLRRDNEKAAALKASNYTGYELTKEDEKKIQRLASAPNMGQRHYVDPESIKQQPGPFSGMKPGQYAFEPASCAAMAAA